MTDSPAVAVLDRNGLDAPVNGLSIDTTEETAAPDDELARRLRQHEKEQER